LIQIQIKLFEETSGLKNVISTSSIIEGVNTSAENVILWSNRIGSAKIKDFTYRNIIGRGGRMFKYFVGKIYFQCARFKTTAFRRSQGERIKNFYSL
jgi:replicative superfamily II helicase